MKVLFVSLVLLPSIGLCTNVIVTPNLPGNAIQREVPPPNVHVPSQHPVITVPGVAGNSHGQRVIVVPKHQRRAQSKTPKVIINKYAKSRQPGYSIHRPR